MTLVLLIAALILAIIGAVGVAAGRINLLSAAFACYVAAQLVGKAF